MVKPVSIDQSHAVIGMLQQNVDWGSLDGDVLQKMFRCPKEVGKQFTTFLKNGGLAYVGEPKVIQIDRTKPFDPATFMADGWSIVEGEQDERSLALTEVNLHEVRLVTTLRDRETLVNGEEKPRQLKEGGDIRLDAKVFQTLWENQHLIPERFKERTNGNITFIYFDGTVLQSARGLRYVLYLYWSDGGWCWSVSCLSSDWYVRSLSAVFASHPAVA